MEFAKGMATGFIVGVAAIGVAVALLYHEDDSAHERNAQRIAKLEVQVQQLERAVSHLSGRISDSESVNPAAARPATLTSVTTTSREADQAP